MCIRDSDNTMQPISSVEMKLYRDINNNDSLDVSDTLMVIVFTDGDTGDYCFEDITPGEYIVVETQPINFYSISDYDHTTTAPDTDCLLYTSRCV